ncbi:hypothetical protein BN7_1507 [Wickerhamomyces ciferrii]|uniref:Beta-lactamase-related domain-containing protein n=1 Tax=Wickerhamomyces ciferrii (strain ATCC 14091 / BCRC 22168 / CBS 111 / JCM 3599 / NBRC 0793 / NRRL Y-1031 F-60-10) TaxID=1206466 RepID=K0KLH3_WICCF|nr:uncharacterized protein BN7_1507 [Wickerhamomyces ciferrii]CCH41968.1 hypothetical protein BN7_1507 [Wickerhamomyces ciferrii]
MPAPTTTSTFSQGAIERLQTLIKESVKDSHRDIPGVSVAITNSKGDDLFQYAAGKKGADSDEELTTDSIFWIASCTKLLASIALMQLVEKGVVDLDSSEQIEKYIPELKNLPIASNDEETNGLKLKPSTQKITLRHLLSHTSGLGYSFFSDVLKKYTKFFHIDEFDVSHERELLLPLLFEPGSNWAYGVGIDWAGVLLQRVTGQSLNDFITEHILNPLGVEESGMEPNETLRQKFVQMSYRDKTGKLSSTDHIYKKVIAGDYEKYFHSGGAGVFSKPKEYIKVLATILNDGVSPKTGERILQKETIDSMFVNQIQENPNFGRAGIESADEFLTNSIPDIYPQGDKPQGWGLSMYLNLHKTSTGRGNNSGWWCGLANLFWWIDRENDIAGFVGAQILPFADLNVMTLWFNIEKEIYSDLWKI